MKVHITIDSEVAVQGHRAGMRADELVRKYLYGACGEQEYGIGYQARLLSKHGLRGSFFVEPLFSLAIGGGHLRRAVETILAHGQDVQLHLHTEWLDHIAAAGLTAERGRNIGMLTVDAQRVLVAKGKELLQDAGAPAPVAFRAGNFGAADSTLIALANNGLVFDSSFNLSYIGTTCRMSGRHDSPSPFHRNGIWELPVTVFDDGRGRFRHCQVCAISFAEMRAMLDQAQRQGAEHFVIVTHSFELLNRARTAEHKSVHRRFRRLCRYLADNRDRFQCVGFDEMAAPFQPYPVPCPPLGSTLIRTAGRVAQQAWNRLLHD